MNLDAYIFKGTMMNDTTKGRLIIAGLWQTGSDSVMHLPGFNGALSAQ